MRKRENRNDAASAARKHWGGIIAAIFFLLLVFSNALLTTFGVEILKEFHENRNLAPFPKTNSGQFSLSKLIIDFDAYLNDHFFFRKPLLISLNTAKYFLFNVSPDPTALPAKEGWIFYGIPFVRRDYARETHLSDQYVEKVENSVLEIKRWLNARGIGFIFVLAPNKHNIYPQYMPSFIKKGEGISNGEWLVEHLAKMYPDTIVNVFQSLHRAANKRQVYFKIDTHWNSMGAMEASKTVFHMIRKSFPALRIKPLPQMKEINRVLSPGNFGQVMGVPLREEEALPVPLDGWNWKNISAAKLKKMLPERTRVFQRVNPRAPQTRVLVLGDSFMGRFDYYIAEMFGHSIFVNLWDTQLTADNRFPTHFIENLKPDLVNLLFVERRLQYGPGTNNEYVYSAENPGEVCKAINEKQHQWRTK